MFSPVSLCIAFEIKHELNNDLKVGKDLRFAVQKKKSTTYPT